MKRVAILCVAGIAVGYWYPGLAIAAGVGLVLGWFIIPQPEGAAALIDKAKELLGA